MVGHQHVGVQRQCLLAAKLAQIGQHAPKVGLVAEYGAPVQTALHNMMHASGQGKAS